MSGYKGGYIYIGGLGKAPNASEWLEDSYYRPCISYPMPCAHTAEPQEYHCSLPVASLKTGCDCTGD